MTPQQDAAKRKRLGPYAKLSATYYRDDALMAAGEAAEVLFCRSLAFCAETPSDGYITERQVVLLAVGLRKVDERVKALVEHGIWEKKDGGYVVRQWLKWNRSADEAGMVRRQDRDRKAKLRSISGDVPAGMVAEQ